MVVLGGSFALQGICIWGLLQGQDGLIVGLFGGIGQAITAVTTWYFTREGGG